MLISFTLENWMSFCESAKLSLIASRERQHPDRIARINKYPLRLLPVCAIYGGNASGKTNLFKALNFVRNIVSKGTYQDRLIPFNLGSDFINQPSRFCIEILVEDTIYELSFTVTKEAILEERLVKIVSSSEHLLYERKGNKYKFLPAWEGDMFLKVVEKGTEDNQLFLTNCVNQKDDRFKPVYDWFKDNLVLIAPDMRFGPLVQLVKPEHPHQEAFIHALSRLDTGIVGIGVGKISLGSMSLPEPIRKEIEESVKEGETVQVSVEPGERFEITRKGGELIAKTVVTYHESTTGEKVKFDIDQESDGTKRVIDLLPAFLRVTETNSSSVFLIDELDRSLHTLLTNQLLEAYLASCNPDTRSQILFTTHDVLLMDQNLLRRDEMYVTERDQNGSSSLFSFSEYKDIRKDKDIRKSYLQGRLGGIPRILLSGPLDKCDEKDSVEVTIPD